MVAATTGYAEGVKTYQSAHDANLWLANAYSPHAEKTEVDKRMADKVDDFLARRADLLRLGIGPYKDVSLTSSAIFDGSFVAAVPLKTNTTVSQRFQAAHPFVRAISFQIVTWGVKVTNYTVHWTALGDDGLLLGAGDFLTYGLSDWKTLTLKLNNAATTKNVNLTFSVGKDDVKNPIGIALFPPNDAVSDLAVIDGVTRGDGARAGLLVQYER